MPQVRGGAPAFSQNPASGLDKIPRPPLDSQLTAASMTELLVYAPGLRDEEKVLQLGHQMDMLPARYKLDAPHDMVYFEIDDPNRVTLKQFSDLFENIGLQARFVGQIPTNLRRGDVTDRLV